MTFDSGEEIGIYFFFGLKRVLCFINLIFYIPLDTTKVFLGISSHVITQSCREISINTYNWGLLTHFLIFASLFFDLTLSLSTR